MPPRNRVAAVFLLGMICAGIIDSHCDVPEVTPSRLESVTEEAPESTPDDACGSVCVPDCYSCSRSEEPPLTGLAFGLRAVAAASVRPDSHPSDGIRSLPYHPPLQLL